MSAGVQLTVGVLDYGSGNLHSACKALQTAGARVVLSADPAQLETCHGLLVPGVGAFSACMAGLRAVGGDRLIRDWVDRGRPVLGICVGHQVLFGSGVEHGVDTPGVAILPGRVDLLAARRLPHMGWNTVRPEAGSRLFAGLAGEYFYFVHSYGVHELPSLIDGDPVVRTFTTHEADEFLAGVEWRSLSSVQFHPEKSGEAGARLLSNWLGQLEPA